MLLRGLVASLVALAVAAPAAAAGPGLRAGPVKLRALEFRAGGEWLPAKRARVAVRSAGARRHARSRSARAGPA